MEKPAYVICINGWPGAGKLAIARGLHQLIPDSQILHNHELIDPVEKHHARGSAEYYTKRGEYRRERLAPIAADPKLRDTVWIFTDSQTEYNECVADYAALAQGERGRRFYSVILNCEMNENERRLIAASRGGSSNGQLTDVQLLRDLRRSGSIWKFGNADEFEIDVTSIEPREAAEAIKSFVDKMELETESGRSLGE
nr:hypothetical protein B0A51_13102 [Rachicladosporium sp. CCFEE 5018]